MLVNNSSENLPVLYDGNFYNKKWLYWHLSNAHLLIAGTTGSGKTVFGKLVCGRIANHLPHSKLAVLDYKGDDYSFLEGCSRYYLYSAYSQGIEWVYQTLQARIQGDTDRTPIFALMDEFPAFINRLLATDKKAGQAILEKFGEIMFLGRSKQIHVIGVAQRPDAVIFSGGTRDQFSCCVGLGRLSEEGNKMLFGNDRHNIPGEFVPGEGRGFLLQHGDCIRPVIVPRIHKMDKLEKAILHGVTR